MISTEALSCIKMKSEDGESSSRTERLALKEEKHLSSQKEVVPRVMALAYSLLPQVEFQFRKKQAVTKSEFSDGATEDMNLKSTGLDEDLEGGLYTKEASYQSPGKSIEDTTEPDLLPPSALKVVKSLLRLSSIQTSDDCSITSRDEDEDLLSSDPKELFGNASNFDVREEAGDALLNSIRDETITPKSLDLPFWDEEEKVDSSNDVGNDKQEEEEESDTVSISSYDDEDDLRGELNRLGNVIMSLQSDLTSAEVSHRHLIENNRTRTSIFSPNTLELAGGLKTWRAIGRAITQDNVERQDSRRIIGSASSLYWAVALVWAIVILFAGHVKFSSEMEQWPDFLAFILRK